MAIGWHPDLVGGALIGALVKRIMTAPIGDEFDSENNPNPDYVPAQDITCSAIQSALNEVGLANHTREVCFTMAETPVEFAAGNVRVAISCVVAGHGLQPAELAVAQAAEAALRRQIDLILATFA